MGQLLFSVLFIVYFLTVQANRPLKNVNTNGTGLEPRTFGVSAVGVLSTIFTDAGVKPCKPCQNQEQHRPRPNHHPPPSPLHPPPPPPSHGHYEPPKGPPSEPYEPIESNVYVQPPIEPVRPVKPHPPRKPHLPIPIVEEPECNKKPTCPNRPSKHLPEDLVEPIKHIEPPYQPPPPPHKKPAPPEESYPEDDGQEEYGCICVPYYQCDNGRIVDDGAGIIDPRIKEPPKKELPLVKNHFFSSTYFQ